jgi:uncharacterized protein YndB with AHSA1/START domain
MRENTKPLITIEVEINAPLKEIWNNWTSPDKITRWYQASDDWHTPHAENDLRPGGRFLFRMEAKDGSFGFDFYGIYDAIKTNEYIKYTIGDGRKVKTFFNPEGKKIKIVQTFEAESQNSIELQKNGWQSILNSFKNFTELN